MKTTTTTTTTTRRRPTPLKKAFLGLGVLGFGGASTTTTTSMALETECDVCHVNYFHKVERGFHSFRLSFCLLSFVTWRRNVMMMMPFFFPLSNDDDAMVDALLYTERFKNHTLCWNHRKSYALSKAYDF